MTFEEALRIIARRTPFQSEAEAAEVIRAVDDFTDTEAVFSETEAG